MPIKTINADDLKRLMDEDEVLVIDVREPAEYASHNIEGATLLPLNMINRKTLPKSAGKKIVIHCHSGNRSSKACMKLIAEDPALELYNLEGGIAAWRAIGHDVQSSGDVLLPLDRQVQCTIGSFVLVGSLLSYFVNPLFCLFTSFFGAGLIFAGLSGFCGLAILLSKMPWNRIQNKQ